MPPSLPTASVYPAAGSGLLRRHRGKLWFLAVIAVLLGLVAAYVAATLAFTYSDGERVGYVQKLSSKGWVCRTWEGELAMTPVPGSTPQLFIFSVPDEDVAASIAQSQGKRVALRYEQKRGVPSSCFGETEYFVTAVRLVSP